MKVHFLFSSWRQFSITAVPASSCQVLAKPVGQACKLFWVTLLTEEMIQSPFEVHLGLGLAWANLFTIGLIGRYFTIFYCFTPEETFFFFFFFPHVIQCVWINIYSLGQDQLMCYSNPLGDAEDTLYTLLLKGEGAALCIS